jgi:hypothetical protein
MILEVLFSLLISSASAKEFPILPDPALTPGVVDQDATMEKICLSGYTGTVRNVSSATKKKVFEEYGIDPKADNFEIDHLISLELGGSNDIKNLWPQSYTTMPWNAHVKDRLENKLHRMICDGIITMEDAQKQISTDWIKTYKKYIGEPKN